MAITKAHREFFKAYALQDTKRADEIIEQIPDSENGGITDLLAALFSVLVEERFDEDPGKEVIQTFVNEMRYDFRSAEPSIKPLVIEGLIRAAYGETHLLDEIDPADSMSAQYKVILKISSQPAIRDRIDYFLDEAVDTVKSWDEESPE